jgi:nuclear pore complex protein Nup54
MLIKFFSCSLFFNVHSQVNVFGDDRDELLRRWNMLQASWGIGKAYYHAQMQPIPLSQDNTYCRFKAIGYSALPKTDKVGLV